MPFTMPIGVLHRRQYPSPAIIVLLFLFLLKQQDVVVGFQSIFQPATFIQLRYQNIHQKQQLQQQYNIQERIKQQQLSISSSSSSFSLNMSNPHNNNTFQQQPGESKDAYFRRITLAASDPTSFENAVLKSEHNNNNKKTDDNNNMEQNSTTTTTTNEPKKTGYVRAEVWEEEQQLKRKNGQMSWEERVQFDGQRYGNQFNQNEILRKNLKGF